MSNAAQVCRSVSPSACLDLITGQSPEKSPEDWIRIVSTDGYSCLVRRKVAMTSGTLRDMLDAGFAEASANTCRAEER